MGEVSGEFSGGVHGENDERVHEWEEGLPNPDDLAPLSQGLIPADLLSAFNIRPESFRTSGDVVRASHATLSTIQGSNFMPEEEIQVIDEEDEEGSESKKARRSESELPEDVDSAAAKALKRPRLVWTPQLHKRFVDVVAHLGIKNAVPKTIMQLMNVEGLTRENVASHLQKYRLYLKRMQGISFDAPSNSSTAYSTEHLFGNSPTPAPACLLENGHVGMSIPMPYGPPPMMPIPMPMMGTGHGHMGMGIGMGMANHSSNQINQNHYHHYQYNGIMQAGNNKYGSMMSYHQHQHPPRVAPGDK